MNRAHLACLGMAIATVLARSPPGVAQVPTPPIPTAADSAALVLGLARQLRVQGNRELAQDLLRLVMARFPGTPAADSAGGELAALTRRGAEAGGIRTLAAWGALYGGWLGVAIPAALGAEETGPYGAGILIGVPSGFFAGRGLARSAHLSAGQARAITWGSLWGSFQGIGWRAVLEIGDRQYTFCDPGFGCYTYADESDRAPFTASILGGIAGIGTAALLARSREMSSGSIAAVQWGALWGGWFGGASSVLFDVQGEHAGLAMTLVGGNLGLVAAAVLAPHSNLTAGRPWLISAAGLAGMAAGFGIDLLAEVDDDQTAILLPMAGSAVGLVVGSRWTRPKGVGDARLDHTPGALFQIRGGRLGYGEPTAVPAAVRTLARNGRVRWETVLRIPLVSVALP